MTSAEGVISIGAALARFAREKPDQACVDIEGDLITWRELHLRSNRMARGLLKAGVKFGDFLTIALPNDFPILEVSYACWKIGAIPQVVSYRLPPAELNAIAELANTPIIVSDVIEQADRKIYTPAEICALSDDESDLPDCISPSWKAPTSGGSTGRPKLIVSTQPGHVEDSRAAWHIRDDNDVFMVPAPLYHNAPYVAVFNALQMGCPVVMLRKFDPEKTLSEMQRRRVTLIYMVPTMMGRIWRLPEEVRSKYDISSLRTLWHVSAPCPAWLKEAWIGWIGGEKLWEKYGSSEAVAATRLDGHEWLKHRGSVGRVFFGEIKIVLEDGTDSTTPGEVGEVYMRRSPGAKASYQYVGSKPQTMEGGWESVGDIGWFDADGYLYLADRRTDMILVGGANVYPAEVEAALEEHPLVQSSCVIGLPDDDMGNTVHAIIQTDPSLKIEDLQAHLADRLVSYKRPRSFERVSEPLRGDDGKVRRSALREERIAAQSMTAEPTITGNKAV